MNQVATRNTRTREEWTEIISVQWEKAEASAHRAVDEAIETGQMLIEARLQITNDRDYGKMLRDAGLTVPKAAILRTLASSPVGQQWSTASLTLPRTWTALLELAELDEKDLEDAKNRSLISPETGAREARAIVGTYQTPEGEVVGEGKSGAMLPSPSQAKEIAEATGRVVAGSDGRYHTPMPDGEVADYEDRRDRTYSVIDAINALAPHALSPSDWFDGADEHWLADLSLSNIEDAAKWLDGLAAEYRIRDKVIDA